MDNLETLLAANAHHQAGRLDDAETLYRAALAAGPSADAIRRLIALFVIERADADLAAHRFEDARKRYQYAVDISPGIATGWMRLGNVLANLGLMDDAIAALRRATQLDPGLAHAHRSLAAAGQPASIAQLTGLLADPGISQEDRIDIGFSLAMRLDQDGDYDAAFAFLRDANEALKLAGPPYDPAATRDYVGERMVACSHAFFATRAGWGVASELPVFVVGMPRSGTTLVEQILSSHSRIIGLGEGHRIGALDDMLGPYGAWDRAAAGRAAGDYITGLKATGGNALRIVDKTPDNLFHLGLIGVLFPGARVIFCWRDPRDIALSCYFQTFADPMPYANDLAACADRIKQTDRLTDHWLDVLPLQVLTVDYEAVVAQPEAETRRMMAFLGLDWEAGCLDFHRTRRTVESASLWQVRRPLFSGSVGRWRRYERHLEPLLRVFGSE
jgi:tetratricopeptide (TPR) repeat protein